MGVGLKLLELELEYNDRSAHAMHALCARYAHAVRMLCMVRARVHGTCMCACVRACVLLVGGGGVRWVPLAVWIGAGAIDGGGGGGGGAACGVRACTRGGCVH